MEAGSGLSRCATLEARPCGSKMGQQFVGHAFCNRDRLGPEMHRGWPSKVQNSGEPTIQRLRNALKASTQHESPYHVHISIEGPNHVQC